MRSDEHNDFYYFTGIEDQNSILVILPKTKQSYLFLPRLTASNSDNIVLRTPKFRANLRLRADLQPSDFLADNP